MQKVTLDVQDRDLGIRAAVLRRDKQIPAVVYGHSFENLHLMMDYQTFRRTFEKATFSTIINLQIEGKEAIPVLVHDVQYHPVTDEIVHVDFYKVRMDQKVTTHVTLEFVGESEAVKLGAILNTTKHDLEITCLPTDLVHHIEVDISVLKEIGDSIRVEDIPAPSGIEILDNPEDTIVSAIEPRVVEEEEPTEAAAAEGVEGEEAAEGGEKEGGEAADEKGSEE